MPDQTLNERYQELESLLDQALKSVKGRFQAEDIRDVQELIEHGEYGAAWYLLSHLIEDEEGPVPEALVSSGKKMELL